MKSYPIWNRLIGLPYTASKDFGAVDDGFTQKVFVRNGGKPRIYPLAATILESAKTSFLFVALDIVRHPDGRTFSLYVDGELIKRKRINESVTDIETLT
jgi:hypothetical protein